MGRAQVVQAEAAGIAPTCEMNPILLKPTNDTGTQVIVNGEVRGDHDVRGSIIAYKKELIPAVLRGLPAAWRQSMTSSSSRGRGARRRSI